MWWLLTVQMFSHYCHGGKEGSMQADMVLELSPYILTQRQQEVNCLTGHGLIMYEPSKRTLAVTHFLQQDRTSSNKATRPNSVSPFEGRFLSNHHKFWAQWRQARLRYDMVFNNLGMPNVLWVYGHNSWGVESVVTWNPSICMGTALLPVVILGSCPFVFTFLSGFLSFCLFVTLTWWLIRVPQNRVMVGSSRLKLGTSGKLGWIGHP